MINTEKELPAGYLLYRVSPRNVRKLVISEIIANEQLQRILLHLFVHLLPRQADIEGSGFEVFVTHRLLHHS